MFFVGVFTEPDVYNVSWCIKISLKTMESRLVPNLFFAGEVNVVLFATMFI